MDGWMNSSRLLVVRSLAIPPCAPRLFSRIICPPALLLAAAAVAHCSLLGARSLSRSVCPSVTRAPPAPNNQQQPITPTATPTPPTLLHPPPPLTHPPLHSNSNSSHQTHNKPFTIRLRTLDASSPPLHPQTHKPSRHRHTPVALLQQATDKKHQRSHTLPTHASSSPRLPERRACRLSRSHTTPPLLSPHPFHPLPPDHPYCAPSAPLPYPAPENVTADSLLSLLSPSNPAYSCHSVVRLVSLLHHDPSRI
ncbi:hypothetical protein BZA05DRAFT_80008 [Tricharina praecox]|uniref:uncharacterized protein n=1 Tax=Tricharina praecox TaxID=43433 RepID=UPI0022210DD3|nr:uncharacterized protein BZA05DRAFT_80008 [Tricharina praecox]KAI5848991.1 hypothetical protein BZA05DRAFT_80008 [Tricharina praecox]